MKYIKIKQIAKGWSSYIFLAKNSNGKKVTIKEVREKSNRKNLYEREGKMLTLANTINIGPKLLEINKKKNFVVYNYINGENFLSFVENNGIEKITKKELYNFIKELYFQCIKLDNIGLIHTQLQVGKNIMITKKNKKIFPVIIDFEKSSIRTDGKTKNVGQIESFLFYNPNGFVAKKIRKKFNLFI